MTTQMKNMQARIPAELHLWLKMHTLQERTTINELVARLLWEYKAKVDNQQNTDTS